MGFFVENFDTHDKRAVLRWCRDDHDPYDQWGWCMSWLFDIAGEMYNRGFELPALGYRPSPFGVEISEDRAEGLALLSDEALLWGAQVLNRFDSRCRAAGLNY